MTLGCVLLAFGVYFFKIPNGFVTGGVTGIATILAPLTLVTAGAWIWILNIVAASSFFVYGTVAGLFSLLGLFAKAFIVDAVMENLNTCKYFVVITDKREEISEYIIKTLRHGVTVNSVIGKYTKQEKTMIHTVCRRMEAIRLRDEIKRVDPHAFIIVTTSSEIIGRGFRSV